MSETVLAAGARSMKPILRYPGSKWRLAPWIASLLPRHEAYVEPFFGSGAVFFTKEPSRVEVVNDLSGNVVIFFRVLRDRPDELARAIELTPYSREEYALAHGPAADDELERARRFFCRAWMSYAGKLASRSGWRAVWDGSAGVGKRTRPIPATWIWDSLPERVAPAAIRLKGALIECRPALDVIRLYRKPEALIFADPPYLAHLLVAGSARPNDREWARYYEHTMDEPAHVDLLDALDCHPGPVLLAGYRSALYDERLPHWTRIDRSERSAVHSTRVESLWLNPTAAAAARQPALLEVTS